MTNEQKIQIVEKRYEKWAAVFEPVTEGHVEVALLLKDQFFNLEVFGERYEGKTDRIKLYILMYRLYHFLFFAWFYDVDAPEPLLADQVDYRNWTRELCRRQEFQDVHGRYKEYYPQFGRHVDQLLSDSGQDESNA